MENALVKIDEYLSFFGQKLGNVRENSDIVKTASSLILREMYQEARTILMEVLGESSVNCRLLELYGVACDGSGDHQEAISIFNKLIQLEPDNPDHFNNISMAYAAVGQKAEALSFAIKAVQCKPIPVYMNNLGLQFRASGMIDESIEAFKKALQKYPDPFIMVNLATAYGDKLDYLSAIEYCESAISVKPELSGAHVNLAYYYHMVGRRKEAWPEYEHRIFHFKQIRDFLSSFEIRKKWNGYDSLNGKRVLVICEQGLGDTIHFIRYVSLLKKMGCYVVVFGPLQLASLCEFCEGVDEYICKELPQNLKYDYFVLLLSLPYLLKCEEVPNKPYLTMLQGCEKYDGFNIGICWRGSKLHAYDGLRSINPALFFEISVIPGIQLHSLQKDDTTSELQPLKAKSSMKDVKDFKDTASIILNMDLVISVDTSVLHLAGAMGKEVWGLIPYRCDWRWGLNTEFTDWYPTMRLYRQEKPGNWAEVFEKVKNDLQLKLKA